MKKIVLTGDRPTGPLHLGHYVGSLLNRVEMQEIHKQYVMIADIQALTDNFEDPMKVRRNIFEVVKDYISVGIDPSKTTIFLQSQIQEIAELTIFFMNLVTLGRLERNPTVKTEMKQKGFGDSIPVGFLCYPVSQAADITVVKAEIVPVGEDQLPMIEQTNEIVRKFNRLYNTDCLKEAEATLGKAKRLVGIDGAEKAGKSLGNAIFLSDSVEQVKNKVFSMYTDPNHLKISDPGNVEGNVVFTYLDIFHSDKEEVKALKAHYRKGGLGDVTIKQILQKSLEELLAPIREKRASVKDDDIYEIIKDGIMETRKVAANTTAEVKDAMSIMKFI
jgi:tryptophanyl-tRNA synthetase